MFKELKEDVENVKKMMYEQSGNINKETENLKKKKRKKEMLELETQITEMKNSLAGLEGRYEPVGRKDQ